MGHARLLHLALRLFDESPSLPGLLDNSNRVADPEFLFVFEGVFNCLRSTDDIRTLATYLKKVGDVLWRKKQARNLRVSPARKPPKKRALNAVARNSEIPVRGSRGNYPAQFVEVCRGRSF